MCVTSEMLHKFDWIQLILIPNKHIPVIQQYYECKELKTVHILFIYLLLLVFKFKLICNDCTIYGQHAEWLTFHMKNIILYFFSRKVYLSAQKNTHTHLFNWPKIVGRDFIWIDILCMCKEIDWKKPLLFFWEYVIFSICFFSKYWINFLKINEEPNIGSFCEKQWREYFDF